MSDILLGDKMKWKMRVAAYVAQKMLRESVVDDYIQRHGAAPPKSLSVIDMIHDDLRTTSNIPVSKIYRELLKTGSQMKENHHASNIIDLAGFALWVLLHDTAYRDPFFYALDDLANDQAFKDALKPLVRPPETWYCPTWHDAKETTKAKTASGDLLFGNLSPEENVFVPELQQATYKEMQKKMKDELEHQSEINRI